ncbi:UDP-4-amino-4-deoxy-L-arabinose--oxoglutarate aminotransferase [bioreactor metagenome]|uniref:UDP-4-amino-4-deoxy-L-arabinose--oxoglutarate aminotransferase n=1 Tax=bioreactor metagenome TaxID=1076179 RepID=A0A645I4X1_9ZZZZ
MFDIQAAMGLRQMDKLDAMQERRKYIAQAYNEAFGNYEQLIIPKVASYTEHSWHLYVLQLDLNKLTIDRDEFIELMNEENIGTSVHFIPVHLMSYYKDNYGYKNGDFPVTESYFERIISLPLYPKMSDEDVEDVINAVTRIIKQHTK